ncbi:unnamed protein product [Withania somnifera]
MASGNWANEEELEVVNEDGFVYKRRKRCQLDTTASALKDPALEEKNRLQRKKRALMKIKDKYQYEINQWELLSNTLQQNQPKRSDSTTVSFNLRDPLALSSVEAQEAVIGNISKLCDVVDAIWTAQEEKTKQSVLNLPVWAHAPNELISSLCTE